MNEILQVNRNPLDISEALTIPLARAKDLVRSCQDEIAGWGRLHMQPHLISRRHVYDGWPVPHRARLDYYRKLHDQGRVTMCQGRDGVFILQYAIPTKKSVQRTSYFEPERYY